MSATADKAQYFLEQSVPELKEYERKKIFSPEEITSIAKKRSDFEHKINARGSSANDYAAYAEFEINVDTLRRKRVKRLAIKSTAHNGQRRVFFVFDRGTRKFPGDVGLWTQGIEYARKQKAYKKLSQMFTNVLRLHPAKSELWIYAASCAVDDQGDMQEARSYMQRGLRFCKTSRSIWYEYMRLEMAYMAKIHARRQILGVGKTTNRNSPEASEDLYGDFMSLGKVGAEDINPDITRGYDIDQDALRNLDNTPAMSGAIPVAIFEAAMTNFSHDLRIAHGLFEVVVDFGEVPVAKVVLGHILENMRRNVKRDWRVEACLIARTTFGMSTEDPEYPAALRSALQHISSISRFAGNTDFSDWCRKWLASEIQKDLDPALETVLSSKIASL